MRRRDFLALSSLGIAETFVSCSSGPVPRTEDAPLLQRLVRLHDARVPSLLDRQQLDRHHAGFGGIPDQYGLYHAGAASGLIRALALAYVSPQSRYHLDGRLPERIAAAAGFLREVQNDDGTIDLITTNFHSPPDTGFVLEWVCSTRGILAKSGRGELRDIVAKLDEFIIAGADALAIGGIHTPNHRWVVSMALARANSIHPDPRYVARIDEWLAEKIDIDRDGQFTERSTSIYSPLVDRCLLTTARLLGRPALLEPVRRNLEMTIYYVHADGEVATEASKRQDQYRHGSLAPYHYPYRYMSLHDGNRRFAAMARWIEEIAITRLTRDLVFFVEDPTLSRPLPESAALPTDYEKEFEGSQLVRIRRGPVSATVLADNPTFFSFHRGSAAVVVRFASAFFGKGQFVGSELTHEGDAWVMRQELVGPYYQPYPRDQLPGDGDWSKMPRERRPQSEVQRLRSEVRIQERRGAFEIEFRIDGCDRVPVAIELGFRPGGKLSGTRPVAGTSDAHLLSGEGRFRFAGDEISFGPGRVDHRWVQLRGALPKLEADSVYLTGYTPFRHRLRIA